MHMQRARRSHSLKYSSINSNHLFSRSPRASPNRIRKNSRTSLNRRSNLLILHTRLFLLSKNLKQLLKSLKKRLSLLKKL